MATGRSKDLSVLLGDDRVGTLTLLPNERIAFTFDQGYIEQRERPTLSLGFKDEDGRLVEPKPTRMKLPPFFSNMLPEGHLREYLAAKAGVKAAREFFLIAALGEDLPGAVRVLNPDELAPTDEEIEETEDTVKEGRLKFSLAGMQLKFSALAEPKRGYTIPVSGAGGNWILKLPSSRFEALPEHEAAMLTLAGTIGITVPKHQVVAVEEIAGLPADIPFLGKTALAIERFDRGPEGKRVHIEDFAQIFGLFPDDKYGKASHESIGKVIRAESDESSQVEYVRRLVFSVMIGNADMHIKNWSMIYPDRIRPQIAPAYDFVATVAYLADDSLGLSIGGEKLWPRIGREQFTRFADTTLMPVGLVEETVQETAKATRANWKAFPEREHLPKDQSEKIESHMKTLRLLTDYAAN